MSEITCIIVEDEPLAAKVLADYSAKVPFLKVQAIFEDAILATAWLRSNHTDLIFLDIHLPKLKGMDFLRSLPVQPKVVITTAYHEYAVEGFNLNVTDYLLKPIPFERFMIAINKVRAAANDDEKDNKLRDHIFITTERKKVKILFSKIIYIESLREYVKIVTAKKEYISKMTTNEIESLLPADLFQRIHRSYIISLKKIDSYTSEKVEIENVVLPIGREYRSFIKRL